MSSLLAVPVAQPSSPRSKAVLHLSMLFSWPWPSPRLWALSVVIMEEERAFLCFCNASIMAWPGKGAQGGSGEDWVPSTGELLCTGLSPDSLISSLGGLGGLLSAGYFLTKKGNLFWSSFMLMCQQTLRGEHLHAVRAFCFIGSQKLYLIRVTYSPCPPRNVSSAYQHLAK